MILMAVQDQWSSLIRRASHRSHYKAAYLRVFQKLSYKDKKHQWAYQANASCLCWQFLQNLLDLSAQNLNLPTNLG